MAASTIIINDADPRRQYTATAAQTAFDFPLPFFATGDLTVYLTPVGNEPDDASDLMTITTDYTVTGEDTQDGGLVTLVVPAAAGDIVTIERVVSLERLTDFQVAGDLLAETLNQEQDTEIMISQQLRADIDRAPKRSTSSASTADLTLPEPEAGKALGWNGGATALENVTPQQTVSDQIFDTKSALVAASITAGLTAHTRGYIKAGDEGEAPYLVKTAAQATTDGDTIDEVGSGFTLANGNLAVRQGPHNAKQWGMVAGLATSDTTGAAANTAAFKAYRDWVAILGGTIHFPEGEYVGALDADTVAKDTFNSRGCAFELVSWVNVLGEGAATGGASQVGTRFNLSDGQNCDVMGNYENTLAGLSGCWMDHFTVNGNRDNNLTAGDGIFIGSVFTLTGFGKIKVVATRGRGIGVEATSTPIWLGQVFCGDTGEEGVYIDGASSGAVNIMDLQCDNAGVNGTGEAGFKLNVGSTENTNVNIFNYRYEHNITSDPNASPLGIVLNNLNGCTVNIYGGYGFSNDATATDFIKVTGATGRVNIIGTTCNSNYTNVFNDVVSGRVIAQSTSGIPAMFEALQTWQAITFKNKGAGGCGTSKLTTGNVFEINNPADGAVTTDTKIYGTTIEAANFDESGSTGATRGRTQTGSLLLTAVSGNSTLVLGGPGSPEGRGDATAPVGSVYLRNDGGAGTTLYVKESGAGNTGWVAK